MDYLGLTEKDNDIATEEYLKRKLQENSKFNFYSNFYPSKDIITSKKEIEFTMEIIKQRGNQSYLDDKNKQSPSLEFLATINKGYIYEDGVLVNGIGRNKVLTMEDIYLGVGSYNVWLSISESGKDEDVKIIIQRKTSPQSVVTEILGKTFRAGGSYKHNFDVPRVGTYNIKVEIGSFRSKVIVDGFEVRKEE